MKLAQVNLDFAQQAVDQEVPGTANLDPANHASGFGALIGSILSFSMLIAAILVLLYLIWGAFEWITSQGDKSKLESARQKITGAILGIVVLATVLALFMVVQLNDMVLQQFLGIEVFTFIGGSGGSEGTPPVNNNGRDPGVIAI